MFDLPTKTKEEKRNYVTFRNVLVDLGFSMVQFSVYVHYSPTGLVGTRIVRAIKGSLPPGGDVRIVHVTDKQWSKAVRFFNAVETKPEETPDQLLLF